MGTEAGVRTPAGTGTFLLSDEREEFRRSIRGFLHDRAPEAEVRRLMATDEGFDRATWTQMAAELNLQGLAIPEPYGGSGYGYNELVLVFEEMGRALLCAPYFSTVGLAANALLVAGDDAARGELLPPIAGGETVATLALTEDDGRWDETGISLSAVAADGAHRLEGHKTYVIDGHLASLLHGDRISVRRSQHHVRFLHPRGWSYYATLRRKLRWYEGVV